MHERTACGRATCAMECARAAFVTNSASSEKLAVSVEKDAGDVPRRADTVVLIEGPIQRAKTEYGPGIGHKRPSSGTVLEPVRRGTQATVSQGPSAKVRTRLVAELPDYAPCITTQNALSSNPCGPIDVVRIRHGWPCAPSLRILRASPSSSCRVGRGRASGRCIRERSWAGWPC